MTKFFLLFKDFLRTCRCLKRWVGFTNLAVHVWQSHRHDVVVRDVQNLFKKKKKKKQCFFFKKNSYDLLLLSSTSRKLCQSILPVCLSDCLSGLSVCLSVCLSAISAYKLQQFSSWFFLLFNLFLFFAFTEFFFSLGYVSVTIPHSLSP